MSALLLLRAVTAAGLLAVADTLGVQRTADDLVPHAREVLHTTAAHQHDRVLLQVVADARDVGGDLDPAREPHAGHLAQRRVRLLGGRGVDARAHAATLGAALERRGLGLLDLVLAALTDQLLDRGHQLPVTPSRCFSSAASFYFFGFLPRRPRAPGSGVSRSTGRPRFCRAGWRANRPLLRRFGGPRRRRSRSACEADPPQRRVGASRRPRTAALSHERADYLEWPSLSNRGMPPQGHRRGTARAPDLQRKRGRRVGRSCK